MSKQTAELRELRDDELERRLREAREAYFNLRFQHASGALERTSEIRARRREIAASVFEKLGGDPTNDGQRRPELVARERNEL